MPTYPTRVYQQAMIVLDNTSASPEVLPPLPDASGRYTFTKPYTMGSGLVGYGNVSTQQASLVFGTIFTNVPVILKSELINEYQDVGQTLNEMTDLEEGNEFWIEPAVYSAACFVAAGLMASSIPAPRVLTHGPNSVVFNWSDQTDNLYLTVSADRLSALISSPERITRRVEYSIKGLISPSLVFSTIRAAYTGKPIKLVARGSVD